MELGVYGLNAKATLEPTVTARLARRAEELGYKSWWVGEHVVLPSPRTPDSPLQPTDPMLDPLIHLAYVAAVTERMELGTGIVILPSATPWCSPSRPRAWTCLAQAGCCSAPG